MISLLLFAFVVAAMILLQSIQLVLGTGRLVATDSMRPQLGFANSMSMQLDGFSRKSAWSSAIPPTDGATRTKILSSTLPLVELFHSWTEHGMR